MPKQTSQFSAPTLFSFEPPRKPIEAYDTTLRDGTQGEGVSFSSFDKMRIAERLDEFGVSHIEGGWPGSNPKDAEFFELAKGKTWKNAKLSAFGATRRSGIPVEEDPQIATLLAAETPSVTFVGKAWNMQVKEILRTDLQENLAMIRETAAHLKSHGREAIFDAEHFFDGFKESKEYALDCLRAAVEGGSTTLVLCDTNGGTLPREIAAATMAAVSMFPKIRIGIHTHNDSGLAVANALAAIEAGASHVQGTANGYGERNGNCDLLTTIANLQLKYGQPIVARLDKLTEISRFVDEVANRLPNPAQPFVGRYAFNHKGGQHVNAVSKLTRAYEHVVPESIGNRRNILVSELSGRSNILLKAEEMGIKLKKDDPAVGKILERVKELENLGFEFESAEASFELLIRKIAGNYKPNFRLLEYHCTQRTIADADGKDPRQSCEATVKLAVGDQIEYTVSDGDGPVNALDHALRRALICFYPEIEKFRLADYKVRILDGGDGTAARTRVLILSTNGKQSWGTVGVDANIISASWQALVDSVEYAMILAKQQ